MSNVSKAMRKMIAFYKGSIHDINHTMKVYTFAKTIGEEENLDPYLQETLELTAIVHDLSCPYCKEKYGCSAGYYQQIESEPLVREFFADFALKPEQLERIVYLVTHHHTYRNVDGLDYQILLEADYLVNCDESMKYKRNYQVFLTEIFQTETGKQLLQQIFEEKKTSL